MLVAIISYALPAEVYTATSKLASGKWVKIQVKETGMQFLSASTLRNLGFTDINKVNVYGYGGQMLSERLDSEMKDDLPLLPSIRTSRGIMFFGQSTISWAPSASASLPYTHQNNPYSDNSYYFISDSGELPSSPTSVENSTLSSSEIITSFTERIVHEQDLLAPSNTGRLMLGEDFRTQNSRSFQFNLPGIIGDATMSVRFGAKVTNGTSSLIFTANGKQLPSTSSDKINGVSSSETFLATTTTTKVIENCDEKLNLTIRYSNSGAIFTAGLDYITLTYPRELRLTSDELYFYLSPSSPSTVRIEGCDGNTVIWNVTDPQLPVQIIPSLTGSTAEFAIEPGYQEFIAFNPLKVSRTASASGRVNNQDIHGMKAPGMLIISPDAYRQAAQKIADLHTKTDGLEVAVLSPEAIYNEFSSGVPDVTAFRKLFKMWFDRSLATGEDYTRYCLIMSRPTYDNKAVTPAVRNAGYPRVPIWQSPSGFSEATSYSTDDYIGMLDDYTPGWDISKAKIHVAVGRMPVKNNTEALNAVAKLEKYLLEPNLGSWRNNVMVIADDQDNGTHLTQAESVCDALSGNGTGADYIYERLYLDSYTLNYSGTGPEYPEAKQRMFDKLAEGVMFWNYIGHASPKGWGHENLLTWSDISSLSNTNLPFLYAATCEFLRWDSDEVSGGEEMWLNPTAGVIGMICPSRTVYISLNGPLNVNTSGFVFRRDGEGNSMRIGDIMTEGKNTLANDNNKLRYGLIGDPAMRLPAPRYRAVVESIDGKTLDNPDNLPVLGARSTVEIAGYITDLDGSPNNEFNGTLQLQIFDAEQVITTNGNGKDGKEISYNDRKTRLYIGKTKVENGRWQTIVKLPSEIENNYSPALLSLYASDADGNEANGSTDRFYIYGYSADVEEDNEGPEIKDFFINSPTFSDGMTIGPAPIVHASLSDPSGLNLSDAGIGHSMTLTLDNSIYFNDVAIYYSPDENDPCSGDISYRLSDLQPGDHSLTLTVWDNANNSSSATLSFRVAAGWLPEITDLSTDVNPASANVNFLVTTDSPASAESCLIEVYDLSGRKVWSGDAGNYGNASSLRVGWDLCDYSGARVPRGIYPYRAILTTSSGAQITRSGKLAVTAK